MQEDTSKFPDPIYKRTVLAPLFDGAKLHFITPFKAINQAHLVMLSEASILSPEYVRAIAEALIDIENEIDTDELVYTGEHEDYFYLVESELQTRLGPDIAGMLHTARSRNDMDHTVFKMVLKHYADSLLMKAQALANTMLTKATSERDTLIVAYTHGQPAQPTTYGHYLAAALEVLLRDIERLHAARDTIDHCPMGAAAITTSGFNIDRIRIAELLGFKEPLLNSYGCIASVDYITGWYSAVKLLFLHLGRLIQDLQFWSAFEVGQLYVPNSLVQVSSIMPQKRNPVPIEHLRHLSSTTCGQCDTIVNTMHNTPFTDMNDSEGAVQIAGYSAMHSGSRVLDLLNTLIKHCSINEQRVSENISRSCITITELADTLVRVDALSFRQAHEVAALTASNVTSKRQSLLEGYATFSEAFEHITNRQSQLNQSAFEGAVGARHFVNVRGRVGGPAPQAMDSALAFYNRFLDGLQQQLEHAQMQEATAKAQLATAFAGLMEH